jgi:hypothetical protein
MSLESRPWTVERYAGSVVEVFVRRLDSTMEVERFSHALYNLSVATPDAILVVDLRAPTIFSDEVASAVVALMVRVNAVRKKTAILFLHERAIFGLQLGRITKQAGDPRRRTFTDPAALINWLDPDLTTSEKARIRAFLNPRLAQASAVG